MSDVNSVSCDHTQTYHVTYQSGHAESLGSNYNFSSTLSHHQGTYSIPVRSHPNSKIQFPISIPSTLLWYVKYCSQMAWKHGNMETWKPILSGTWKPELGNQNLFLFLNPSWPLIVILSYLLVPIILSYSSLTLIPDLVYKTLIHVGYTSVLKIT